MTVEPRVARRHPADKRVGIAAGTRSAVADALRDLPLSVRRRWGIGDIAIALVETGVMAVRLLLDDRDQRPAEEKMRTLQPRLDALDLDQIEAWVNRLGAIPEADIRRSVEVWAKRATKSEGRRFVRRLLGASAYDRLLDAVRADGAVLAVGLRRAARSLGPLAVAVEDLAEFVPPTKLERIEGVTQLEHVGLTFFAQIDQLLDKLFDLQLPLDCVPFRPDEVKPLDIDLVAFAARLRPAISTAAQERVRSLSEALSRKIQGAAHAIDHSPDGVSQAANSMVEFIDRLMRNAFTDTEVLEWCDTQRPQLNPRQGNGRPTKSAQVRCFAYAGMATPASPFHEVAIEGLLAARDRLQAIKHADGATDRERDELRDILHAVEGFFLFSFRLGWSAADDAAIARMRERLSR